MKQRVRKHIALLRFLIYIDTAQQKHIIKFLTDEQCDVISEIVLNIYTGTYPLTKQYIKQLTPYKPFIRVLGSREKSSKRKRQILSKHVQLLSLMLKPIVQHFNKRNGKRNDINTETKIRTPEKITE